MSVKGFEQVEAASREPAAFDPQQEAVLALAQGRSAAVLGAPGSGKTATIVELIRRRVRSGALTPDQVLVLTPARVTATRLRDRIALALDVPTNGPLARSITSFAFEVVGAAARAAGHAAPRLVTGAEQDADLAALLAGHLEDGTGPVWPSDLTAEIRSTSRFRTELRELLARATEYAVDAAGLREYGRLHNRSEWAAAADFMDEYLAIVPAYREAQLDAAELTRFAVGVIEGPTPGERVDGLRLVILDDAQDATEGTFAVLRALALRGVDVIAFGDPDIAVNTFRGAELDVLGRFADVLGLESVERFTLTAVHRQPAALRAVTAAVTNRIGASGAGTQRAPGEGARAGGVFRRIQSTTPAREWAAIAAELRRRHLRDGVPWNEFAVVVRTRSHVELARRALAQAEVPVRVAVGGSALRDDPAARALLAVVEVGIGRVELTPEIAAGLLLGPFGGFDRIGLRRLRLALRVEEVAGGGRRSSDELLAEAIADPVRLVTIDHRVARQATRLAETIAKLGEGDRSIEELLWSVWDRSGLATTWRDQALGSGIIADEANRNLDGIVALFTAAKRFAERQPDQPPGTFLAAVLDADVPEDTLSPQVHDRAVLVTTPAGVVGLEFDTVVVAALQDGVWPNLRLRGSLLAPQEFVRAVLGIPESTLDQRRLVRDDELRLFALAVSRAKHQLILAAVANDDEAVSPFVALLPETEIEPATRIRPLSLRTITGRLRRTAANRRDADRRSAIANLAALAALDLPGADPAQWHGLIARSSELPLYDGQDIRISPSAMEKVITSPLDWFVSKINTVPSGMSASIGTIIHSALETAEPDLDALWQAVKDRWSELVFEAPWLAQRQERLARGFTEALAEYLEDFAADGKALVGSELEFTLQVDGALVNGKIDRVERESDGAVVIVDLKTGRPSTAKETAESAQLGAYQVAYAEGHLADALTDVETHHSGGAKLLFVKQGRGDRRYREESQVAFTVEQLEEFRERVRLAATLVAAAEYEGDVDVDDFALGDVPRMRLIRTRAVSSD